MRATHPKSSGSQVAVASAHTGRVFRSVQQCFRLEGGEIAAQYLCDKERHVIKICI